MKKIFNIILILMLTNFIGVISVKAISISATADEKKQNIIVDVTDANGYVLTYDKNYQITCNTPAQNSNDPYGKKITTNGKITFNFKYSTKENKRFTFGLKKPGDSESTVHADVEINKAPAKEKPQETTQAQTTTAPAKSNNANLKSLSVVGDDNNEVLITPSFDPNVYEYSADVLGTIKTVQINATLEDAKANVIISNNANEELKAGENNKITITVTAEDGTKKAYTLNVKREALTSDATLKELTIDEVSDFKFKENKYKYTIKVNKNVKTLTLYYVLSDENSTVEVEGNEKLKDGSKVRIIVTAEDGTKKEYVLTVSKNDKKSSNTSKINAEKNPLIIMGLTMIAFGLVGGIIYTIRK